MKTYILQEKVPSRSDFKWTFSGNCEGTEQLQIRAKYCEILNHCER